MCILPLASLGDCCEYQWWAFECQQFLHLLRSMVQHLHPLRKGLKRSKPSEDEEEDQEEEEEEGEEEEEEDDELPEKKWRDPCYECGPLGLKQCHSFMTRLTLDQLDHPVDIHNISHALLRPQKTQKALYHTLDGWKVFKSALNISKQSKSFPELPFHRTE